MPEIVRSIRRLIAQSRLFALFGAPIGDGPLRIDFALFRHGTILRRPRLDALGHCGSTVFASVSRAPASGIAERSAIQRGSSSA